MVERFGRADAMVLIQGKHALEKVGELHVISYVSHLLPCVRACCQTHLKQPNSVSLLETNQGLVAEGI